ncbi:MAG TPA: hypothetical protein ENK04_15795 [Gammaproteobacteria bacterium]|nr:hypothetical protein [Gammaproteobacteria bacterium]
MGVISATQTGWWHSAPLPDQRRIIAFQTDSDQVDAAVKKDPNVQVEQALTCPVMARFLAGIDRAKASMHCGVTAANSTI